MLEALAKFVDILKATGWQTGFMALAAALYLYLSKVGVLPPLEPWMVQAVGAVALGFAALSAASLATVCQRGVQAAWAWWRRRQDRLAWEAKFLGDIPTLTEDERQILGYLRHYRLRTFDTDLDGGYANTLLAKGYVMHIAGTKVIDRTRVPTIIADDVWRIVNERPDEFPHVPVWDRDERYSNRDERYSNRVEMHPWRIPSHMR